MSLPVQMRKRLVVDADIARSANDRSKAKRARDSYLLLQTLFECKHCLVIPRELLSEWHDHQSFPTLKWLINMAQAGLLITPAISNNEVLRKTIKRCADNEGACDLMLKDVHLLEAALCTDKIVASLDKKVRKHFARVCEQDEEIKDILWVNPETEEDSCTGWLREGAPVEPERQLGYKVDR